MVRPSRSFPVLEYMMLISLAYICRHIWEIELDEYHLLNVMTTSFHIETYLLYKKKLDFFFIIIYARRLVERIFL